MNGSFIEIHGTCVPNHLGAITIKNSSKNKKAKHLKKKTETTVFLVSNMLYRAHIIKRYGGHDALD